MQPLSDIRYPYASLVCLKHLSSARILLIFSTFDTPFFPPITAGVIVEQDRYDNHHPGDTPQVHAFTGTAAFSSFNRCIIAKHGLINSRLKTVICSGRITAISGNIVSSKKGVRQKRYNRACYGPGFSPGRTGVIWEDNGKTLSPDPPTSRTPAASSSDRCNVAKHGLIVSLLITGICSGKITAISGNVVSPKKGARQKRYNRAFYGPGFSPTGTGVIQKGLLPSPAPL